MVQLGQAPQHPDPRRFGDGEANAVVFGEVRYLMEAVAKVKAVAVPAVGLHDGLINFAMETPQIPDAWIVIVRVVETVVELREPNPFVGRDLFAERVVVLAKLFKFR